MKKCLAMLFSLGLLVALTAVDARADLAPPKPSPKTPKVVLHTSLRVEPDAKGNEARLQIGENSLRELRAALNNLPNDGSRTQSISQSSTRTILAGLSLFLALSFGGVWLARSNSTRNQKAIAALLIVSGFLSAAAIITRGNAGPPPAYRWRNLTQNLNDGKPTSGTVDIEIVSGEDGLKLIVPLQPKNRPTE